jgi:pimeloyl-ACP methyl ester carboxylesterase
MIRFVAFAMLMLIAAVSPGDPAPVPRLEPAICNPAVTAEERVECSTLVVRENRARTDGPLVRIPVRIYRSRSPQPAAEPVLWMSGGPGGSAFYRPARNIGLLDTHDLIILSQRGTRDTQPALICPQVAALKERLIRGTIARTEVEAAWGDAAESCAAELRAANIDPGAYNTRAIAEDIEDLRVLLGRPRLNLYGESYSTRVMLILMRDHPDAVRSAVLDSPMPLESRFDEVAASSLRRALDAVVGACAVTPSCATKHPDLRANLDKAFTRYGREPVNFRFAVDKDRFDTATVGANQLAAVLGSATRTPPPIKRLPDFIDQAAAGNLEPLGGLFAEEIGPTSFTMGMRIAVWCADVVPFEDPKRIAAQSDPSAGAGGAMLSVIPPSACARMHLPAAPAQEGEAVRSDIPTLILSGELDPWTPPMWGRRMLRNMPNAQFVEIAGRGHTPGFSACSAGIIARFIRDPGKPASEACATRDAGSPW